MTSMTSAAKHRHLRPVKPLAFPASDPEWEMGETRRHGRLCDLLFLVLRSACGDGSTVGKDNFVYWDASDPRKKCAPDAFVKLGVPERDFDSWKSWEHGAPELCVEIVSPSDAEKLTWEEKMERYLALGILELVAFDPDALAGRRLRAWDRIDGDLVERVVEQESTPCDTLGLHWVIVSSLTPGENKPRDALRLAHDARAERLVLTQSEQAQAEAEAEIARLRAALAAR